MERFPPNDGFHYDMPRIKDLVAHTLYAVNWSWEHVFGTVGMLDLWNQNQISSLFRIVEPVSPDATAFKITIISINVVLTPL